MTDLHVMCAGITLLTAGVAWVFPPAGLMVAGVLLVAVAWPERGGDGP